MQKQTKAGESRSKDNTMKIRTQILLLAVITTGFTLATQAQAQYRAVGEDGIAASPKVRQMLNDAKRSSGSDSSRVVAYQAVGEDGISASPKFRQMLREGGTQFQIAPIK